MVDVNKLEVRAMSCHVMSCHVMSLTMSLAMTILPYLWGDVEHFDAVGQGPSLLLRIETRLVSGEV